MEFETIGTLLFLSVIVLGPTYTTSYDAHWENEKYDPNYYGTNWENAKYRESCSKKCIGQSRTACRYYDVTKDLAVHCDTMYFMNEYQNCYRKCVPRKKCDKEYKQKYMVVENIEN